MSRRPVPVGLVFALALAGLGACGGGGKGNPDAAPAPDADPDDILFKLQALPGVTATESPPIHAPSGYRYFLLGLDQPVDHDHPEGAHFTQHMTLILRDPTAPLVLFNTGYWNYYDDYPFELTLLLHGNQLVMEHRFFGDSRPDPADWTQLTIAQAAADQHAVVQTFQPLFTGTWVSAGQSKGGMTSIYHHRFYPDDLGGTVAYVAPISFGAPDTTYDTWVNDTLGTQACRDGVKAVAKELLWHRRTMLITRATAEMNASSGDIVYARIQLGPAVEGAVESLYWSFWQYYGETWCGDVPVDPATATDDELWQMLEGTPDGQGVWRDGVSPVSSSDDANLGNFEAYDYQAAWQLGYPGTNDTYLDGLTMYGDADFTGSNPVGVTLPPYDNAVAMNDVESWVKTQASHVIWVYGGWDPWTGGQFDITGAQDAVKVLVTDGNHGSLLTELAPADQTTTFAMLTAWTGVTPDPTALQHNLRAAAPRAPEIRIPAALLRARWPRSR